MARAAACLQKVPEPEPVLKLLRYKYAIGLSPGEDACCYAVVWRISPCASLCLPPPLPSLHAVPRCAIPLALRDCTVGSRKPDYILWCFKQL